MVKPDINPGYWFVASANFYGEDIPITVDFKLPTWSHQTLDWKKICMVGSSKLIGVNSSAKLNEDLSSANCIQAVLC